MQNPKCRVGLLVFASSLEILLFGGIQFGWSSIVFILKEEGFYKDLCSNKTVDRDISNTSTSDDATTQNTCFNQDKQLNLLYSVAMALVNVLGVVCGEMLFRFGIKPARIIFLLIFMAGAFMLAFASVENPWLIAPGLCFVGLGGVSLLISNMQVVALIGSGSSIYVGILNGLFDSSVLTQTLVKEMFEAGIKRVYSYSSTAILALIISGLCTILLPSTPEQPKKSGKRNRQDKRETERSIANSEEHGGLRHSDEKRETFSSSLAPLRDCGVKYLNDSGSYAVCRVTNPDDDTCSNQAVKRENRAFLLETISSKKYLLHTFWYSIMQLRLYYFYGALNRTLEQTFTDIEEVRYFTDVLAYTMMGGLISSYFAGQLMFLFTKCCSEPLAIAILLLMTSGFAILLSCLAFAVSPESFYVTFITVTVFRSFLFAETMQFIVICFPQKFKGFVYGLLLTVAGLISLLQYALFVWTDKYMDAVKHVNAALLALILLSLAHPVSLIIESRRTSHHKQDDLPL